MLVLDREAAVEAWRRAEARIYPSVMVNAELYQQYIGVVRAVAEELRDVRTEDDLVTTWCGRSSPAPPRRCWRSWTSAPCATPRSAIAIAT